MRGKHIAILGLAVAGSIEVSSGAIRASSGSSWYDRVLSNITDKNQVVEVDAKALKGLDRWPLTPGEGRWTVPPATTRK